VVALLSENQQNEIHFLNRNYKVKELEYSVWDPGYVLGPVPGMPYLVPIAETLIEHLDGVFRADPRARRKDSA
jgi:hypothetical protein